MKTLMVTVTYGRRWHLLRQAITAAKAEGISDYIVIDNGSAEPIEELSLQHFGPAVRCIRFECNRGSALAYGRGIQEAINAGADYILLLDDDNILDCGAFEKLYRAVERLGACLGRSRAAVCAFRKERIGAAVCQIIAGDRRRIEGACLGFHVLDIPKKLRWRLWPSEIMGSPSQGVIKLPWAAYGGLMFHRSMVELVGLPDASFILYQDDVEFTNRMTAKGGVIHLVLGANIRDAESSWNMKGASSAFFGWLRQNADFRVYYTFRNSIYFEWHKKGRWSYWYPINAMIFACVLVLLAVLCGRISQLKLLSKAAFDGISGKLGVDSKFPLPKN